jgi:hypothetical protein
LIKQGDSQKPTSKKANREKSKLKITQLVVMMLEPQGPRKIPKHPPKSAPKKGRKTILKYIFNERFIETG